jgi:hypothetical protein
MGEERHEAGFFKTAGLLFLQGESHRSGAFQRQSDLAGMAGGKAGPAVIAVLRSEKISGFGEYSRSVCK